MYRKGQKTEFYTELAKKQNYPARSVYKLKEINEKYGIFKNGQRVLDLGCAPGSWFLYISEKIGDSGNVVGVDIEDINIPLKKNMVFIKKSIFELKDLDTDNKKFDAIVSDMAPSTSGVKFVDAGKSLELVEESFKIVKLFLKPGGTFIFKIFESAETADFFKQIGQYFDFFKRFKPKAVIKQSKEFYIVAKGFKGNTL
jgi:23S rRNA (uridine2552-2'-O)-methyltransferase